MKPADQPSGETYCCNGSSPDDIVITGMSGKFPNCDNIAELSDGLYSMKCLSLPVESRWEPGSMGLECSTLLRLKDISRFDNEFFRFPRMLAEKVEPEQRLLLEAAYEAVLDSGYNPEELRGSNIGVYCASSNSDSQNLILRTNDIQFSSVCGLECLRANRISHFMDFVGPSYCVDAACSSSVVALHSAVKDIKNGICEAALVCGAQLTLNPEISNMYKGCGILTLSKSCYPFEERACGMIRSEAVVALYIQKASAARRSYARIGSVQIRASGFSEAGISHPLDRAQIELFHSVAAECKLDMNKIPYIEAHGTGTHVGDPIEIQTLKEVYCQDRVGPLMIGTIKSNLGHPEAPSGLSSIIKAILAFETGYIAPNYDFKNPNLKCLALLDGSVSVVSKPTLLTSDWILVNSFGFGGNIGQIALQRTVSDMKKDGKDDHGIPQLVLLSATCEDGVSYGLQCLSQQSFNREFFTLLNNLAFTDSLYKPYRGYALINKEHQAEIKHCRVGKREVWFVLTGMGCQWPGMGNDLMVIESFARSIHRSARALQPLGVDLLEIMKPESTSLTQKRRILPAFVGICAIQIALIDVLWELGIEADGIIGHSTGELVCAYADGCCTAEETILSAYYRGYCTENSDLPDGAMAAVGMTWEEAVARCPKDVYAACHNAEDSITISGLKKPVEDFTAQLKKENCFARVVDTYGYAFHSPPIHKVSLKLKPALDKIMTKAKPRSSRWLSTSYTPQEWENPQAKISDSSYFVHNLISPVRFAEAAAFIPKDAITIEIGPHALLQSLLKRVIGSEASFIGLMKRNENNVDVLLSSIGKLYTTGLNPKISRLYPSPRYPVPRGTPVLSNLIKWNHATQLGVPKWEKFGQDSTKIDVDASEEDQYLLDHCIDGRSLYPATGYIYLAWVTLAKQMNKPFDQIPVVIENFMIHRASILSATDKKTFSVSLLGLAGEFEIAEGNNILASGRIHSPAESLSNLPKPTYTKRSSLDVVTGKEVYSELKINGYEYGPNFQAVMETSLDGSQGLIKWEEKWIPYLDAHLIFFGLIFQSQNFSLPTSALSVKIDPTQLKNYLDGELPKGSQGIPVNFKKHTATCYSPGVEIKKLKVDQAPRSSGSTTSAFLEQINFVPYVESCAISDEKKKEYEKYNNVCCEMAKLISISSAQDIGSSKFNVSNGSPNLEEFLNHEQSLLLQILQEFSHIFTSDNFITNVKTIFRRYICAAGDDLLYQTFHDDYPLGHILATVMENSPNRVTVTEVANGAALFTPVVADIMKTLSTSKAKLTLLHPEPETLDSESLNAKNIDVQLLKPSQSSRNIKNQNLVISSFFFGDASVLQSHIKSLVSMVQPKGFILLLHRESISPAEAFLSSLCDETCQTTSETTLRKVFAEENLIVISKKSDTFGSVIYLLRRKDVSRSYVDTLVKIKDGCYNDWVDKLKDAFAQANDNDNARLWIVAEDSPYNGIIGLVRCLNKEPGGDKIRCIFLMKDQRSLRSMKSFSLEDPANSSIKQNDLLMNIYKDGHWGTFQSSVIPYDVEKKAVEDSFLDSKKFGDLSSLQWYESQLKYNIDRNKDKLFVHIYYTALNFHDVMIATGKLNASKFTDTGDTTGLLGLEYSGKTPDGRRVMCLAYSHALATSAVVNPLFCHTVPDHWSLEEAATVPVIYFTCYYSLIMRAGLAKGQSVLIHSGTGGVGIAAIRIALSLNCNIFVTVGTLEKREYLKKLFPQIDESQVSSSRDTLFEDMILEKTHGKGVHVVLNSLADDKFQASIRCVATHGHFIEIGKYDLALDRKLGLSIFLRNISFDGVSLDMVIKDEDVPMDDLIRMNDLFSEGIRDGVVQPLDRTVFKWQEAEEAFRYMASGRHMGKVLLKVRDGPSSKDAELQRQTFMAIPCTYFYSSKSYIVIGGLGGCGIELVKWMQKSGARNIVLTSRYGIQTGYHQLCIQRWRNCGMNIIVSTLDVSKKSDAKQLLSEVNKIAPIGGIFNSAVVLKDAFLENQTAEDFAEACAPKAEATKYLDEFSRSMCPSLDYFVCFSSISCGKGNAGQTNYGYANSVMERVCEQRRSDGLHGLCVQWGIIGDVGVVHRHMGEDAVIAGVVSQKITSCLNVLSQFLQRPNAVLSSYNILDGSKGKKMGKGDFLPHLAKVFGLKDISEVNRSRSFLEMGIDSMVGVELQQLLENRFDLTLSIKELQTMTVTDLEQLVESAAAGKSDVPDQATAQRKSNFILPDNLAVEKQIVKLNAATSGIPIFIIHHSEIEAKKLQSLTEKLNCQVYGLQFTKHTPIENLSAMSIAYLKDIGKIFKSEPIHLIGYRNAATLVLQMAKECLKEKGVFPTFSSVNILDGSLELVNNMQTMEETDVKAADEAILIDYLSQYSDSELTMEKGEIEQMFDFEAQVAHVINLLSTSWQGKFDKVAISDAVHRYIDIHRLMRKFDAKKKIPIDIGVVEVTGKLLPNDVSLVKASLSKICSGKISINRIPGDCNFLIDPETTAAVANVINKILDSNAKK